MKQQLAAMIATFTIENFFSIQSAQTLSFEPTSDTFMTDEYTYEVKTGVRLLKVGIIYGANASGKSNVLRAIDFFRKVVLEMHSDRNEPTGVVPFLLDDTSRFAPTRMAMTFYIQETKYVLTVELNAQRILAESLTVYESARPTKLYSRTYNQATDSSVIEFGTNLKLSKKSQDIISGNTINNCSVLAAFGKSNVERTKLNDVFDYFSKQVKELLVPGMSLSGYVKRHLRQDEQGELKHFILRFLKASDFNIEDVALHNVGIATPELTFIHHAGNSAYELSEAYESNGTIRFMGMAVILNYLLKENQFMLIDEVETSLHYELLAYFLKVFLANSNRTSQLLLTTHDINLLNEDFMRRDAIWFTDKDKQGATHIERLSALGLHKNLSPYNAYKQGKLVKLPFLGSQYLELND
jgi:AAA15 family ATPase/GTPase